ncbi:immunoglobulin lambda-1 light chain-like [Polypterus senegalus]|uniref:immunoglobulin lambda-1 light chain-like n=1 Tax=Polypterus senegalus TaxID=55291 RepID=UPI001965C03B|nr:immunoglobulin lambda-1 light chain-like [Polypterus senegalus]
MKKNLFHLLLNINFLQILCAVLLLRVSVNAGPAIFSQSPSVIPVTPGQSVTLECAVKNEDVLRIHLNWIRQSPGKAPEGVLRYMADNKIYRAPAISDRFVPSRDTVRSYHLLTINNVEANDDSKYYCFIYYSDGNQAWGERTHVQVLRSDLPRPSVQVLSPPQEQLSGSGQVTLSCLVSGFFPGYIDIQWSVDGQRVTDNIQSSPVSLDSSGNSYLAISYLKLPAADWKSHARYPCVATHESSKVPVIGSVAPQDCKPL